MRPRRLYWLGIMLWILLLSGCAAPTATPAPVPTAPPTATSVPQATSLPDDLTVQQVQALREQGGVVIVDVRQPEEYAAGHIPEAVLIPLGELSSRWSEVPQGQPVIFVCRSGNRSRQAFELARQQGLTQIHNMLGGMNDWIAQGYEVAK